MAEQDKANQTELENEPVVENVEDINVEATEETTETEEVVEEKDELTLALENAADVTDKYLRLQAEFDNYRKRTLKEKADLTKTAGQRVINNLLPVIDDFERAMTILDSSDDVKAIKDGVNLINNKFEAFLTQSGVEVIPTKKVDFDTDKHEAITQIPAPSKKMKGKIIDCVQKGYMLNEKVIRHSKVVIGQ